MEKGKAPEVLEKTVEKNIDNISVGGQQAIINCSAAYRNGGNWGLLREKNDRDYKRKLDELATEKTNVMVETLANGSLILCKEKFLVDSINAIVPGAIDATYQQKREERIKEDRDKFTKFIDSVAAGKAVEVQKIDGGYELVIAIYSLNKVNTIKLNGISYPAYKVTAPEVAKWLMSKCPNRAYVKCITPDGRQTFELLEKVAKNGAMQKGMYKGLEISDTDTGVFMTLRLR